MKEIGEKKKKRLKEIPKSYKNNYLKAMRGKSKSSAIKAFCLECMGWQRNEVKNCCSNECPLHPYRPYQISKNHQD